MDKIKIALKEKIGKGSLINKDLRANGDSVNEALIKHITKNINDRLEEKQRFIDGLGVNEDQYNLTVTGMATELAKEYEDKMITNNEAKLGPAGQGLMAMIKAKGKSQSEWIDRVLKAQKSGTIEMTADEFAKFDNKKKTIDGDKKTITTLGSKGQTKFKVQIVDKLDDK